MEIFNLKFNQPSALRPPPFSAPQVFSSWPKTSHKQNLNKKLRTTKSLQVQWKPSQPSSLIEFCDAPKKWLGNLLTKLTTITASITASSNFVFFSEGIFIIIRNSKLYLGAQSANEGQWMNEYIVIATCKCSRNNFQLKTPKIKSKREKSQEKPRHRNWNKTRNNNLKKIKWSTLRIIFIKWREVGAKISRLR